MKTINFDTSALRTRILDQGTITAFAASVGMSPRTLGSRLAGKTYFSFEEIRKIRTALNLDEDGVTRCFFTEEKDAEMADKFLEMSNEQRALLLRIIDLMGNNPARVEFVKRWTGRISDLPAALAQI